MASVEYGKEKRKKKREEEETRVGETRRRSWYHIGLGFLL